MTLNVQPVLTGILLLLGAAFLIADAKLVLEYSQFLQRRSRALLTWPGRKPPNYTMQLAIGVVLGLLVFYKIVFLRTQAFGETMMFVYYAYLMPLSRRIGRGFYEDGIWTDSSFIPFQDVGGISWREGEHEVTLIVISRLRSLARRLIVPADKYRAARRLLRDKMAEHEIQFTGTGLDLGEHQDGPTSSEKT